MKRAEIFKELKKRNAYKKEYFKMKVPELMAVLEKLNGVSIVEPDLGNDDEEEEPEIPNPLNNQEIPIIQPVPEKPKKIKKQKIQPKQKVIEPPVGIPSVNLEQPKQNNNYRKQINNIINQFEENIYDMLKNFDDGELTENDTEIINHEYEQMYDEISDTIEKILDTNNVSDSYVSLIQKKLNTISLKVQKFLEMD